MKKTQWILSVAALAVVAAGIYIITNRDTRESTQQTPATETKQGEQKTEQPAYTPPNLQPTVDTWAQKYSAEYSIAVFDLQSNSMIAEKNSEEGIFAASLYKLYVAYFALIDFQNGTQNPSEIITAGQTKRECVDKMIRESDSPCGESMMADMGPASLAERGAGIGLTATKFAGIETSAGDSVKALALIHQSKDLSKENQSFLLDAMLNQDAKFKRGLQKGAPEAKWYTKVGWNLDINYHDVGIMTLPNGHSFAIAILGQGSGSPAPIADFAATIYTALTTQ